MKSRICFYFAAVVALVLFVASLTSHATERRDPLIVPEAQQARTAKPSHSSHAKVSRKKPATGTTQKQKPSSVTAEKSSQQGVNPLFEAKDQSASESSSGPGKSAGK